MLPSSCDSSVVLAVSIAFEHRGRIISATALLTDDMLGYEEEDIRLSNWRIPGRV